MNIGFHDELSDQKYCDRNARIILLDDHTRRRADISHTLASRKLHVEPYEHLDELCANWPNSGIILVHESGGCVVKLTDEMAEQDHWLPVIAFREDPDIECVVSAIYDGALDFLAWPFQPHELQSATVRAQIRAAGLEHSKFRERRAQARIGKLTRREREVLSNVAKGLSNRLIGQRLAISPRTVEIHRANMLNKLGAKHTSEAIRIAVEAKLEE